MGNDRVTGASAVGRIHANNQDRHGWRWRKDGSLILAVADGAGSAKHGGEAASAVVDSLLAWQSSKPTMTVAEELLEEMRLTQGLLHAMAVKSEEPRMPTIVRHSWCMCLVEVVVMPFLWRLMVDLRR